MMQNASPSENENIIQIKYNILNGKGATNCKVKIIKISFKLAILSINRKGRKGVSKHFGKAFDLLKYLLLPQHPHC